MDEIVISRSTRRLYLEYCDLQRNPGEGFIVKLENDNIFKWEAAIFGPPNTLYEGGYIKGILSFKQDYPYTPPDFRFTTKMFHPNIYENGKVCMSILTEDFGDHKSFWTPSMNVSSILLSTILLLNNPLHESPVNISAANLYTDYITGNDDTYKLKVREIVAESRREAESDGVIVPLTQEEYCAYRKPAADKINIDDHANDIPDGDSDSGFEE